MSEMTTQRARLRELETRRKELTDIVEEQFNKPNRDGREPAYGWWQYQEQIEDVNDEIKDWYLTYAPALLDELDAMERERDRLRAENEQLRSKFDDLLKTVKPYADKCERQDRLIIALVAGRNIDQLLDEKLGDKPSAD